MKLHFHGMIVGVHPHDYEPWNIDAEAMAIFAYKEEASASAILYAKDVQVRGIYHHVERED